MDTKQQHTAEPWKFRKAKTVTHIFNAARPIAKIGSGHVENPQDESNARRIVACVNACAGIDTVQLEILDISEALDQADRVRAQHEKFLSVGAQVRGQRDKLLEVLKALMDDNTGGTWGLPASHKDTVAARALIAEIENSK